MLGTTRGFTWLLHGKTPENHQVSCHQNRPRTLPPSCRALNEALDALSAEDIAELSGSVGPRVGAQATLAAPFVGLGLLQVMVSTVFVCFLMDLTVFFVGFRKARVDIKGFVKKMVKVGSLMIGLICLTCFLFFIVYSTSLKWVSLQQTDFMVVFTVSITEEVVLLGGSMISWILLGVTESPRRRRCAFSTRRG